jgi:hypothetical protein
METSWRKTMPTQPFCLPHSCQRAWLVAGVSLAAALTQFTQPAKAITGITPSSDATALATALLGPGVSLVPGSAIYTGDPLASGFFTGDTTLFGTPSGVGGVILTSGRATGALPPNNQTNEGTINSAIGSAFLSGLIGGAPTYDASTLQFKLKVAPGTSTLEWKYVFASEEYNEFVNSQYNDVFALALNGTNLALIPGTSTPIAANNVNNGNPVGAGTISNPTFYRDNSPGSNSGGVPGPYRTEYDGLTTVLTSTATGLTPDVEYLLTFAIADTADRILDSGVFLLGSSLKDPEIPSPDPGPGPGVPNNASSVPSPLAIGGLPIAFGTIRKMRRLSAHLQSFSMG